MTPSELLEIDLRCSLIVENAKKLHELIRRSEGLGREVDVHLDQLRMPIVWNGCGND